MIILVDLNNIKKIEKRLGIESLEAFLYEQYIINRKTTREIAVLTHGRKNSATTISNYLKYFNIPIRTGSEAIKVQWENNPERRAWQSDWLKNIDRTNLYSLMQSDEYKAKQSAAHKGEKNGMYGVLGEDSPQWNPDYDSGLNILYRKDTETVRWRNAVFERDKYTCQCCGDDSGGNLNAHHKDGWHWCESGRYDIENGITLCVDCHKEFHAQYGYTNNTKEQLNIFLRSTAIR